MHLIQEMPSFSSEMQNIPCCLIELKCFCLQKCYFIIVGIVLLWHKFLPFVEQNKSLRGKETTKCLVYSAYLIYSDTILVHHKRRSVRAVLEPILVHLELDVMF